jgi:Domain of Unknown Function with PDB structure (DUF3857)/Transglutaminase-like superfamily
MKNSKAKAIAVIFLVCGFALRAQNSPVKPFAQISIEEMKIASCPYDSSASAMILFDKGDAEMDVNTGYSFKRHVRIKIFKKEAADKWATKAVYFDKTDQFFAKFKASTYNLVDGKIAETKIGEDALFKGKYDKYMNQARFTLPQVNDGSIIEYTYTISSHELYGLPDWQFQYSLPVLWSEYITTIPTYFTFRKDWQGFLFPAINEVKGSSDRMVVINAPAFKPEPSMSSEENYVSRLSLILDKVWVPGQMERSYIKSWGSVANGVFEGDLFNQIKSSGYLKKIVEVETAGMTDPLKKINTLYDYVKKNVTWDEFTDVIPDHQFKEVLEKKKGSSSEINAMLISLLNKADIDARPVLLRTREDGFIKPFLPVFSQFNYMIAHIKIGDKAMLIDATDPGLPITALPERCLNGEGLLITGKDAYEWIELISGKSKRSITTDFTLSDDGSLAGKVTVSRDGIYASNMRGAFKEDGEEKYVKSVQDGTTWEISKSAFENIEDYKNPAKEIHELNIPDYGQAAGPVIYINPIVHGRMEENQFKLEKRDYPVDYAMPFDQVYLGKITFPDGYVVEELPKPKIFVLPNGGGKYVYNVTTVGNTLNVVSQFMINKSSFSTEEYPILREFYTQVVAKQAEQVVIKKK